MKKQPSDLRKRRSTRAVRVRGRMISLFDLVKVPKAASDLRASGHAQRTLNLTARSARPSSHGAPINRSCNRVCVLPASSRQRGWRGQ